MVFYISHPNWSSLKVVHFNAQPKVALSQALQAWALYQKLARERKKRTWCNKPPFSIVSRESRKHISSDSVLQWKGYYCPWYWGQWYLKQPEFNFWTLSDFVIKPWLYIFWANSINVHMFVTVWSLFLSDDYKLIYETSTAKKLEHWQRILLTKNVCRNILHWPWLWPSWCWSAPSLRQKIRYALGLGLGLFVVL